MAKKNTTPRPATNPTIRPASPTPAPTASVSAGGIRATRTAAVQRQTKAERAEAGRRAQRRRGNLRLGLAGAVIVVAAAGFAVVSGLGQPDIGVAAVSEGGVGQHIPDTAILPQKNRPPSSGPHSASRAAYGSFGTAVPANQWLHVLEHGGIAVLFKCATQEECDATSLRLRDEVYTPARNGAFGERKMTITPYQDMDKAYAAVAWGRVLELDTLDAAQILAFYDRYLDHGPERER